MNKPERIFIGIFVALWIVVIIVFVPIWQLNTYKDAIQQNTKEYLETENKLRDTLIKLFGGAIVIVGIYLTYRRILASERQAAAFEDGQITERFSRSIEQLGSVDEKGNKNIEIRVGGIYALERISKNSEKDFWPIMEILTSYLREVSLKDKEFIEAKVKDETLGLYEKVLSAEIQAAITVIGRRDITYEKKNKIGIHLAGSYLPYSIIYQPNFQDAIMSHVNFSKSLIYNANFEETLLNRSNFKGAYAFDANFKNASLTAANFEDTTISGSSFRGADLKSVKWIMADLKEADLTEAENLDIDELCNAKTLFRAKLDSEVKRQIKSKCPQLLENPADG